VSFLVSGARSRCIVAEFAPDLPKGDGCSGGISRLRRGRPGIELGPSSMGVGKPTGAGGGPAGNLSAGPGTGEGI